MGYSYQIRTTSALPIHNHYLIANNKIPLKSVTFKSSPITISIFCNNSGLKLISTAFEELLVNLKPFNNPVCVFEIKSATHHKNSPQLNITKPLGLGYA
jgi:hypothetical protein